MKSHALLSGINRRMLVSGLALISGLPGIPFPLTAQTLTTKDGHRYLRPGRHTLGRTPSLFAS